MHMWRRLEADLESDDRVRRTLSRNRANTGGSPSSTNKAVPEELPMDTNADAPTNGVDLVGQPSQQERTISTSGDMLPPLNMTDFLSPGLGKPHGLSFHPSIPPLP